MQTGQNSIVPENWLPQLEQVRWNSVLMDLTVLRLQSEPKTAARSTPVVGNRPARSLANCSPVPQAIACFVTLVHSITFRNKIPAARLSKTCELPRKSVLWSTQ